MYMYMDMSSSQGWASRCPLLYIVHVHVCLYKVWLGRLLHLSFLSTFLKLACYAHLHISMYMYNNDPLPMVQVPHAAFVPSPLLCLFSLGRQTAMVVDVGWQETTILPVSSSLLTACVHIHSSECVS